MLKYILITFVFCFSTPSFGASKYYANNSLSISYEKNEIKNKSGFSINKNALIANKLTKKKRFPIFGIGSIISFVLAFISVCFFLFQPQWLKNNYDSFFIFSALILFLLGICLSVVGLIISEFIFWSVLGLILNGLFFGAFLWAITHIGRN